MDIQFDSQVWIPSNFIPLKILHVKEGSHLILICREMLLVATYSATYWKSLEWFTKTMVRETFISFTSWWREERKTF